MRTRSVITCLCLLLAVQLCQRASYLFLLPAQHSSYYPATLPKGSRAQAFRQIRRRPLRPTGAPFNAAGSDQDTPAGSGSARWAELKAALKGQEDSTTEAAELLVELTLDRLRVHLQPAADISRLPFGTGQEALVSIFEDYAELLVDFLSETENPNIVTQSFWSAQMYLRSLQRELPTNSSVADAQVTAETNRNKVQASLDAISDQAPELQEILQRSVLFARQQFTAAVHYGYFLRRSIKRLRLERLLKGDLTLDLPRYVAAMAAQDGVELVRIASAEASLAVEQRATTLFGSYDRLSAPLEKGPEALEELRLEPEECVRLCVEAITFGASLYDTEEESANDYPLHYTAFGSRAG